MSKSKSSKTDNKKKEKEPKKPNRSKAAVLKSVLSSVKIGSDVMSQGISLPSWLYEPLSLLQRQTEVLEYHHLLTEMCQCENQYERMAYLAAFTVSGYSSIQRLLNNFNPVLGETYEYVCDGMRFFAEQVSHHPPITANFAENDLWLFRQNAEPKTNFLGNILEIITSGNTHVIVKETEEHFQYSNPVTKLHNLVLGKMWLQHHGEMRITNTNTGDVCVMKFKKAGILNGGPYYDVTGVIRDDEGNDLVAIEAKWNQYFNARWIDEECAWTDGNNSREFWRVFDDNNVGGLYDFTQFANTLSEVDELHLKALPPTDSRLRPDRICLEKLEYDEATNSKKIVEGRQRVEGQAREKAGEHWTPSWFTLETEENGSTFWKYNGGYFEQREEKLALLQEDFDADTGDLLDGANAKGTASDYRSYEVPETEQDS
jgi:hypothetical protein